jgi:hypothetical protein
LSSNRPKEGGTPNLSFLSYLIYRGFENVMTLSSFHDREQLLLYSHGISKQDGMRTLPQFLCLRSHCWGSKGCRSRGTSRLVRRATCSPSFPLVLPLIANLWGFSGSSSTHGRTQGLCAECKPSRLFDYCLIQRSWWSVDMDDILLNDLSSSSDMHYKIPPFLDRS